MNPPTRYTLHSPMPFGKYKGWPLRAVPAQYFYWLWHDQGYRVKRGDLLSEFIRENVHRLIAKNPQLRWNME